MSNSIELKASGAETSTSAGTTSADLDKFPNTLGIELDVTTAATLAGDTLDVFIQTLIGSKWTDVAHFTQVLGNGGAKRFLATISKDDGQTMFEVGSTLAAGSLRSVLGNQVRARWDIAGTGSFTFSISATRH